MKLTLGLITILLFLSCTKYKVINEADIEKAFILNSSPTFKGYYYQGSDKSYHYFAGKWDFQRDEHFKIPLNRLKVGDIFNVQQKKEIKIDVLENNKKEFAENEFYRLYFAE